MGCGFMAGGTRFSVNGPAICLDLDPWIPGIFRSRPDLREGRSGRPVIKFYFPWAYRQDFPCDILPHIEKGTDGGFSVCPRGCCVGGSGNVRENFFSGAPSFFGTVFGAPRERGPEFRREFRSPPRASRENPGPACRRERPRPPRPAPG